LTGLEEKKAESFNNKTENSEPTTILRRREGGDV
jgi:hypothetical protein